jgi:hypothetical protein
MCSKLALLLGEGTSSQTDTTNPVRTPTAALPKKDDSKEKTTNWMNHFSYDEM